MNKKRSYQPELDFLLQLYLTEDESRDLYDFIASNSHLPGPRGNLELAFAFAGIIASQPEPVTMQLWRLCDEMCSIAVEEAPVNSPWELVAFCGTLGIGALASAQGILYQSSLHKLKMLARDSRWRMREGVVMALQYLLKNRSSETLNELRNWLAQGQLLELRAIAAALADPPLLKNKWIAAQALMMHEEIIQKLKSEPDRKSRPLRILRQGLGYSWSVVIQALPGEGFKILEQMAKSGDKDILWIVRENLKKNRLLKNFPDQVALIRSLLN